MARTYKEKKRELWRCPECDSELKILWKREAEVYCPKCGFRRKIEWRWRRVK